MPVVLQALAFASCVLIDMLPSSEVHCQFGVPLAVWGAPPLSSPERAECRASELAVPTDGTGKQCSDLE